MAVCDVRSSLRFRLAHGARIAARQTAFHSIPAIACLEAAIGMRRGRAILIGRRSPPSLRIFAGCRARRGRQRESSPPPRASYRAARGFRGRSGILRGGCIHHPNRAAFVEGNGGGLLCSEWSLDDFAGFGASFRDKRAVSASRGGGGVNVDDHRDHTGEEGA